MSLLLSLKCQVSETVVWKVTWVLEEEEEEEELEEEEEKEEKGEGEERENSFLKINK